VRGVVAENDPFLTRWAFITAHRTTEVEGVKDVTEIKTEREGDERTGHCKSFNIMELGSKRSSSGDLRIPFHLIQCHRRSPSLTMN
jgi:hypothetical protein